MNIKKTVCNLLGAALFFYEVGIGHAVKYEIDPIHSHIGFKISHLVISKVEGRFNKFSGEIDFDEKNPKAGTTQAAIDPSSIDTANSDRDTHLKGADFFDVQKYPTMTFKSNEITDIGEKKAKIHGLLNMHGVEKPVVLDVEFIGKIQDPWGNTRVGFQVATKVNRKDFGIVWNKVLESGGFMIGEEVEISINIEGIQKKTEEKKTISPLPQQRKNK